MLQVKMRRLRLTHKESYRRSLALIAPCYCQFMLSLASLLRRCQGRILKSTANSRCLALSTSPPSRTRPTWFRLPWPLFPTSINCLIRFSNQTSKSQLPPKSRIDSKRRRKNPSTHYPTRPSAQMTRMTQMALELRQLASSTELRKRYSSLICRRRNVASYRTGNLP